MWLKYNAAVKRNEVLIRATKWRQPANLTLSERSQSQETAYAIIPFTWNVQKRQTHRDTESRLVAPRGWRGGNDEGQLTRMGFLFGARKMF